MFCPCISVQVACTGVRTATTLRLARPVDGAVPAFRAFFAFRPEQGAGNQPTNPDTMLRPYIPLQTKFCIIDGKSVRVYTPPFSATGTPAVDNNPASKAPESGNGGLFSEVGAEHLNSSRRSCVTCFSRRFRTRFLSPTAAGPRRQWPSFHLRSENNRINHLNHPAKGRKAKTYRNAPAAQSGAAGYGWQLKLIVYENAPGLAGRYAG